MYAAMTNTIAMPQVAQANSDSVAAQTMKYPPPISIMATQFSHNIVRFFTLSQPLLNRNEFVGTSEVPYLPIKISFQQESA